MPLGGFLPPGGSTDRAPRAGASWCSLRSTARSWAQLGGRIVERSAITHAVYEHLLDDTALDAAVRSVRVAGTETLEGLDDRQTRLNTALGGVRERSNRAVLKTAGRASVPWVQIPPPPLLDGTLSASWHSRHEGDVPLAVRSDGAFSNAAHGAAACTVNRDRYCPGLGRCNEVAGSDAGSHEISSAQRQQTVGSLCR